LNSDLTVAQPEASRYPGSLHFTFYEAKSAFAVLQLSPTNMAAITNFTVSRSYFTFIAREHKNKNFKAPSLKFQEA
jgi:hypothetical protein